MPRWTLSDEALSCGNGRPGPEKQAMKPGDHHRKNELTHQTDPWPDFLKAVRHESFPRPDVPGHSWTEDKRCETKG
jgi:hypothetical protein